MPSLKVKAFVGLANLLVVLALALFIPAGALSYAQAWVFLTVFGLSTLAVTLWLMRHDPALLERRTKAGPVAEAEKLQKVLQSLASLAFAALFVVCGFDHRYGWSTVPLPLIIIGNLCVALGLYAVFRVFRENTFTSGTIEVASGQSVVTTGPYAVVRHPMYAGAMVMLVGVPLALGSWWGLLTLVPLMVAILVRAVEEERFLARTLDGYTTYCERVKYRLVPHVW